MMGTLKQRTPHKVNDMTTTATYDIVSEWNETRRWIANEIRKLRAIMYEHGSVKGDASWKAIFDGEINRRFYDNGISEHHRKPTKENLLAYADMLEANMPDNHPSFVGSDGYSYCGMADAYYERLDSDLQEIKACRAAAAAL